MAYVKTVWIDDQAPAIDSINLNHIEQGIYDSHELIDDIIDGTIVVARATTATTAENLTTPIVVAPIGSIIMWGASTIPANYMECNGATLPRTHALFAIYGTTWGAGDGSTTFNIPDMRGQFPRGWDHGKGVDAGRTLGSAQDDTFKSHTHVTAVSLGSSDGSAPVPKDSAGAYGSVNVTSKATGGDETRPKNNALIFLIKVS